MKQHDSQCRAYFSETDVVPDQTNFTQRLARPLGNAALPPGLPDNLNVPERRQSPTAPYDLDEIVSPSQYVGYEHFEQFWPEYSRILVEQGMVANEKSYYTHVILSKIAAPKPLSAKSVSHDPALSMALARTYGLVVEQRSKVGFLAGEPGRVSEQRVVQARSLINFTRLYLAMPKERLLLGVRDRAIKFLYYFTERLERQFMEPVEL